MKRKTKLIMTIASVCIALSVMVFGVYSASSVNFTTTQKITYNMNNVYVDVTVTYKYGTSGSLTTQAIYSGNTYTGSGTSKVARDLTWGVAGSTSPNVNTAPAAWNYTYTAAAPVCEITVKIDNKNANEKIRVSVSALPGEIGNTTAILKHTLNGAAETDTADSTDYQLNASTGTITFRYRRTLDDTSTSVGTAVSGWAPTITAQRLS